MNNPSTSETSSESSTSSPAVGGVSADCKVCGLVAHGVHFGVMTCRACAAFFRRTVVMGRQKKYQCRGGKDKCAVTSEERYQCRLCRYNKCVELGMTPENVQWHRDSFPKPERKSRKNEDQKSENEQLPRTESALLGKPRTVMDVSKLAGKIKAILNEKSGHVDARTKKLNSLEIADYALKKWRNQQRPEEKMDVLDSLPIRQMFGIFERQMIVVAEWLIQQPDFRLLDAEERWTYFKTVWNIWRRFERFAMSVEMFGTRCIEQNKIAISTDQIITVGFHLDFTEITDLENKRVQEMFRGSIQKMLQQVAKPLFDLKPSSVEMAYMLTQMSWQIAGKKMQGKVVEIGERVCDEMANHLHTYYTNREQRSNYAARLVKLMNVVNAVNKIHMEKRETMELARLFDVFKVEFSEPDIFDC